MELGRSPSSARGRFSVVCAMHSSGVFFFGAALNEKFKPIKPPAETERCVCVCDDVCEGRGTSLM